MPLDYINLTIYTKLMNMITANYNALLWITIYSVDFSTLCEELHLITVPIRASYSRLNTMDIGLQPGEFRELLNKLARGLITIDWWYSKTIDSKSNGIDNQEETH